MALSIIIVICLVAFVSGSAYGIFAANAPNENAVTVQEAVETLTAEYRNRLKKSPIPYSMTAKTLQPTVMYTGIRWQDVLAVFSSYVSGTNRAHL